MVGRTVDLRREQVQLVRSRFDGGIGSELDVARAEAELAVTEADAASLAQRRNELEKASLRPGRGPAVPLSDCTSSWTWERRRRRF
ncbi:MAG: hypothetical protein U1G07_02815 [Verrucomicrobiota bacterium]